MSIAGRFQLDVFIASLTRPQMTEDEVAGLVRQLDKPSLLLLEDIDSAGVQRDMNGVHDGPDNARQRTQITASGLLSALDSIAAPGNCILIMTTNFLDTLDPAWTRPGAFQHVDRV